MQTYGTGLSLYLTRKLNPTDLTLYADRNIGLTAGRFYFVNDSQQEWISFTGVSASGSEFTYTGLTRGLTQVTDPAVAGTGKTWLASSEGVLVAMHDQMLDKTQDTNFVGTTKAGLVVKSLTTAQRLALTPTNGSIVYDSTLGENYQYIGGAWSAISSGSTQPNSSTTVAGKVEIATQVEFDAGTTTGGTGALLVATPDYTLKQINTATTKTTMVGADLFGIADSADSGKLKKITLTQLLATTDIQSTETTSGVVERATDAEVITGSDTIRYITPAQAKNNYASLVYVGQSGSISLYSASVVYTFTHNLGKIIKKGNFTFGTDIQASSVVDQQEAFSIGYYISGASYCMSISHIPGTSGYGNNSAAIITGIGKIRYQTGGNSTIFTATVTANTTTTLEITFTRSGTGTASINGYVIAMLET